MMLTASLFCFFAQLMAIPCNLDSQNRFRYTEGFMADVQDQIEGTVQENLIIERVRSIRKIIGFL
jgi:hypothetical protein